MADGHANWSYESNAFFGNIGLCPPLCEAESDDNREPHWSQDELYEEDPCAEIFASAQESLGLGPSIGAKRTRHDRQDTQHNESNVLKDGRTQRRRQHRSVKRVVRAPTGTGLRKDGAEDGRGIRRRVMPEIDYSIPVPDPGEPPEYKSRHLAQVKRERARTALQKARKDYKTHGSSWSAPETKQHEELLARLEREANVPDSQLPEYRYSWQFKKLCWFDKYVHFLRHHLYMAQKGIATTAISDRESAARIAVLQEESQRLKTELATVRKTCIDQERRLYAYQYDNPSATAAPLMITNGSTTTALTMSTSAATSTSTMDKATNNRRMFLNNRRRSRPRHRRATDNTDQEDNDVELQEPQVECKRSRGPMQELLTECEEKTRFLAAREAALAAMSKERQNLAIQVVSWQARAQAAEAREETLLRQDTSVQTALQQAVGRFETFLFQSGCSHQELQRRYQTIVNDNMRTVAETIGEKNVPEEEKPIAAPNVQKLNCIITALEQQLEFIDLALPTNKTGHTNNTPMSSSATCLEKLSTTIRACPSTVPSRVPSTVPCTVTTTTPNLRQSQFDMDLEALSRQADQDATQPYDDEDEEATQSQELQLHFEPSQEFGSPPPPAYTPPVTSTLAHPSYLTTSSYCDADWEKERERLRQSEKSAQETLHDLREQVTTLQAQVCTLQQEIPKEQARSTISMREKDKQHAQHVVSIRQELLADMQKQASVLQNEVVALKRALQIKNQEYDSLLQNKKTMPTMPTDAIKTKLLRIARVCSISAIVPIAADLDVQLEALLQIVTNFKKDMPQSKDEKQLLAKVAALEKELQSNSVRDHERETLRIRLLDLAKAEHCLTGPNDYADPLAALYQKLQHTTQKRDELQTKVTDLTQGLATKTDELNKSRAAAKTALAKSELFLLCRCLSNYVCTHLKHKRIGQRCNFYVG